MIRRYLICFLAALISLQSVVVMADVHELHQINDHPASYEHPYQDHTQVALLDVENQTISHQTTINPPDCHHCCHCHGSTMILGTSYFASVNATLNLRLLAYRMDYRSHISFPDNPPPIG